MAEKTSKDKSSERGGAEPTKSVAQTSAKSTVSGPADRSAANADAATAKLAGTEAVAAAFPYNAAKPSEFGRTCDHRQPWIDSARK